MPPGRIDLGAGPADEACAQVGRPGYEDQALRECRAFIAAIRMTLGDEPAAAALRVARSSHDFGPYLSVVCEFDPADPAAVAYARRCDADAPTEWAQAGMRPPNSRGRELG